MVVGRRGPCKMVGQGERVMPQRNIETVVSRMEPREYEVEVVSRQRAVYRVRAVDREEAERLAEERWQEGAPSDVPGYGWSELERAEVLDPADAAQAEQDAELVLRFLRERERLILRLGPRLFGPATSDAISASQVAGDLGWGRRAPDGTLRPDVSRATLALEGLCAGRRAVCFERPRVRTGERGEIRLYCTPEYLERLSHATLDGLERQAV